MKTLHVAAAVFIRGDKILIARRAFDQPHGGRWEFPGGKMQEGESAVSCIRREIAEEMGVEIENPEFFMETSHTFKGGELRLHVFLARADRTVFELRVHDRVEWVSAEALRRFDLLEADLKVAEALQLRFSK